MRINLYINSFVNNALRLARDSFKDYALSANLDLSAGRKENKRDEERDKNQEHGELRKGSHKKLF